MLIQMSEKDYYEFVTNAMKSADKSHKAIIHLQTENDLLKHIISEQNQQLIQMQEALHELNNKLHTRQNI